MRSSSMGELEAAACVSRAEGGRGGRQGRDSTAQHLHSEECFVVWVAIGGIHENVFFKGKQITGQEVRRHQQMW